MSKDLSNFEQSIKNALEGAELPFNSQGWDDMEQRLNAQQSENNKRRNIRWGIAAGIILLAGTTLVYNTIGTKTTNANKLVKTTEISLDNIKTVSEHKNYQNQIHNTENIDLTAELSENIQQDAYTNIETKEINIANNSDSSVKEEVTANVKSKEDSSVTSSSIKSEKKEASPNSISFKPSVTSSCTGTEVSFDVLTKNIDGNFLWNFGDGNFSNESNPKNTYTEPGIYYISLAVTSEKDGVIKSNTEPVSVVIKASPIADFEWEYTNEYAEVPIIKLTNNSLNAKNCIWTIDETTQHNDINVLTSFKNKGEHLVNLVVTNQNGCIDSKYKYIDIENDYNLLAPKTFSPNNDQREDSFLPGSLRVLRKRFEMSVYNNDQLVYQTTDINKPWDGTFPNGEKSKINQKFPWVVILYNADGNKQYYSGVVTVVP